MLPSIKQIFRSYEAHEIILELAVIWICVYLVFRFLKGTRGAGIIKGFAVLLVVVTLVIKVIGGGTDSLGRFHFADLAPGRYQVLVAPRGGGARAQEAVDVVADVDPEPVLFTIDD